MSLRCIEPSALPPEANVGNLFTVVDSLQPIPVWLHWASVDLQNDYETTKNFAILRAVLAISA
jgi:hypothetical protein